MRSLSVIFILLFCYHHYFIFYSQIKFYFIKLLHFMYNVMYIQYSTSTLTQTIPYSEFETRTFSSQRVYALSFLWLNSAIFLSVSWLRACSTPFFIMPPVTGWHVRYGMTQSSTFRENDNRCAN